MSMHRRDSTDSGASMILAMVFMIVLALIVLALANQASSDLANVVKFTSAQANQQATSGALTTAISAERYFFNAATLNAQPAAPCFADSSGNPQYQVPVTTGLANGPNATMDAWCTTQWSPFTREGGDGRAMRTVTVFVCADPGSGADWATLMNACVTAPLGEATVQFNDQPDYNTQLPVSRPVGQNCLPTAAPSASTTTCGAISSVTQWLYTPNAPTITSVSTSSAVPGCTSGTSITMSGSNLDGAVSLVVVASPASPASGVVGAWTNAAGNVAASANANSVGSTQVQACLATSAPSFASGNVFLRTTHGMGSAQY